MNKETKLIYDLIGKVIEHNEMTGEEIFINVSPHVSLVSFCYYDTPSKKYKVKSELIECSIYYDYDIKEIKKQIKIVKSWLKAKNTKCKLSY